MKPLSIRLRLTVWYFAMFATAAALLSASSWWMLRRSLAATEYHELQERADDVRLLLTQLGPGADGESVAKRFDEVYRGRDDGKYLQVADESGRWVYRSKRMIDAGVRPAAPGGLPRAGTSVDFAQGNHHVRVLAYPILANGRAYSVQTGVSLNQSMALLSAFGAQLLLLTPAVLLLAAIGGYCMSRQALAPVAAIATEARRINDKSLDIRLPIPATRDEIAHLSETLNQMLERVESGVRSIRDFTANAAHELRTPLALIRAEVEVALSKPRLADEYREACHQVQMETVRMTALIDTLLMLARVDAGTEPIHLEALEANQLAAQVGERWKTAMRLALLDFNVEQAPGKLFFAGDASSLQRLLTILLDNALRYTPPGGSVRLCVARERDGVAFAVRDTGIGIAAEDRPRVFDRFYRAERTRSGNSRGSGLGLALAKWIADKHGTSLSLESEVGQGSTFRLALPEAISPPSPPSRLETPRYATDRN